MTTTYDPTLDPEALMNDAQTAAMLGCSTRLLVKYRLLDTGPRYIRTSANRVRYRRKDVITWVDTLAAKTDGMTEQLREWSARGKQRGGA